MPTYTQRPFFGGSQLFNLVFQFTCFGAITTGFTRHYMRRWIHLSTFSPFTRTMFIKSRINIGRNPRVNFTISTFQQIDKPDAFCFGYFQLIGVLVRVVIFLDKFA